MPTHTFGSLFAGVGGFDLGFEAAGWRCGFQVEWDKHCQQILARHWPDVPRWSDVSTVNGAELPPVDCITFGSPCQDLSVAGKRAGLDGNRSNLFFEATRIIKEMRNATGNQYPRVAIWENVPGALSSNKGRDFSAVLDNLADSGALAIEWAVLDAQHFGVPQRRRRIFLVAVFDPAIARNCGTQILPVTQGSRRNTKKGNQERQITAALTANGVGTCGADDNQAQAGHIISFGWQENFYAGETYDEITTELTTTKTPAILNNYAVRRLTPIECERLMGWPDDHTAGQADSHRYKQCGNGVAAPVAQWVAQQLNRIMT
jgi:DNA (cytosine-5)-methyltransferase 1